MIKIIILIVELYISRLKSTSRKRLVFLMWRKWFCRCESWCKIHVCTLWMQVFTSTFSPAFVCNKEFFFSSVRRENTNFSHTRVWKTKEKAQKQSTNATVNSCCDRFWDGAQKKVCSKASVFIDVLWGSCYQLLGDTKYKEDLYNLCNCCMIYFIVKSKGEWNYEKVDRKSNM